MKNLNLKLFFFPLVVLGLIVLVSVVFLSPKAVEIIRIQRQISSERKTLAKLTKKIAELEGIDKVELANKVESLVQTLPPEKDVPAVIVTLKTISRDLGVEIIGINVSPGEISSEAAQVRTEEKFGLPILAIKLGLTGEMDKIKAFLDRVEFIAPLMRIEKISISRTRELKIAANLDLQTFFLPFPQTLGAAETPLSVISQTEESVYQKVSLYQPVASPENLLPVVQSGKENPFAY